MGDSGEPERISADVSVVPSTQKESKKRVITAARKEQNKLAQRAYRRRQREQKRALGQSVPSSSRRLAPRQDNTETLSGQGGFSQEGDDDNSEHTHQILNPPCSPPTEGDSLATSEPEIRDSPVTAPRLTQSQPSPYPASHRDATTVSSALIARTPSGSTGADIPGSVDVPLRIRGSLEENSITVFRACMANAACLGIDVAELMYCEKPCMSTFYRPTARMGDDPAALIAASSHDTLPPSLRPTLAQILVPHHASLDLIPLPRLRERAIMMCAALPHLFSLWEMKLDIYTRDALVCGGRDAPAGTAAQPWDLRSWRASPWFLHKWRMIVDTDEIGTNLSIPGIPGLWM